MIHPALRLAALSAFVAGAFAVAGCPQSAGHGGDPTPAISPITVQGGKLADLAFGIVGDTRPATPDDTASYPSLIITKIFQAFDAANPRPPFVIATGDYIFSTNAGATANAQLDKYLNARDGFRNPVFPAMGNHECTGYTASNCGVGTSDGETDQYQKYMQKYVAPLGLTTPYYSTRIDAIDGSWTSKFVFVASNAWTGTQAAWLEQALSVPTTYTFVIRHTDVGATTAPGTTPSANIIGAHPYTLLIVGHSHTYRHSAPNKQLIVGNGGAPITTGANYGYVIAHRRPSDGAIEFNSYDYDTGAINDTFAVNADGTTAP